ncbi:MAG: LEA type 2 family protein [Dokdonella sp.]|uniref:LEA type 2 family protein n=1 Tax=Dokdonella sp. TaxID=2291710 RepID=UPI003265F542
MRLRPLFAVLAITSLIAACSSGPVRKVHPSTASIQQLEVLPDGHWQMTLRIQNYSTFPMHFSGVEATLSIDGKDVGQVTAAPDLDIVGNNGDVVRVMLATAAKLPATGDFTYQLKGTIDTSEPKETFKFDKSSRLSPVPGVANTYR